MPTKPKVTKKEKVLRHLQAGHTITPLEALAMFKAYRLADIIYQLKKAGHDIKTTIKYHNGSNYAEYELVRTKADLQMTLMYG